jgi:outer membrane immunogenic protein
MLMPWICRWCNVKTGAWYVMSCVLLVLPQTAPNAAELALEPVGEPPLLVAAIPFNRTGLYVGLNAGYGWSHGSLAAFGPGISGFGSETMTGATGGGQFGFNWQINSLVFGIESDLQASGQAGSAFYAGISETDRIPWFGTTRGRVGLAAHQFLLYATGVWATAK